MRVVEITVRCCWASRVMEAVCSDTLSTSERRRPCLRRSMSPEIRRPQPTSSCFVLLPGSRFEHVVGEATFHGHTVFVETAALSVVVPGADFGEFGHDFE